MLQISILGCGWLGMPLAKALIEKKSKIKGSTTSKEKKAILKSAKIQPFIIALETDKIEGNITSFLEKSSILIIDIPPKLRKENADSFVTKIKLLIPHIEHSSIEKVLFISSTAVYGKSNLEGIVTEKTETEPDTESGKQLIEVEQLLQNNENFKTTILRFGGLIGEDRNPVTTLVKKQNTDGDAPVNLIDQKDCIAIILEIINQNCWGEIFNAVAPLHPTREEYYTQKAAELGLPKPQFTSEKTMSYKIISSARLEHILDYNFKESDKI